MSLLERCVTEGNARACSLATDGAMLDGGEKAQMRAPLFTRKWSMCTRLWQYAASFHCLVEEWRDCEEQAEVERTVGLWGQKVAA